jgi:hypothetical protein
VIILNPTVPKATTPKMAPIARKNFLLVVIPVRGAIVSPKLQISNLKSEKRQSISCGESPDRINRISRIYSPGQKEIM